MSGRVRTKRNAPVKSFHIEFHFSFVPIFKKIQALIHTEQDCSDEYYKRIETGGDDSNYTTMHENIQGEYSITDQQTDRSLGNEIDAGGSVIVSVPTMLRREDDIGITTDGGESIYNQNYSIRSLIEVNLSK
jgi:hypothetical protein